MPTPTFEGFMLPLLRKLVNGEEYRLVDLRNQLADELELTNKDRVQLLPSGRQFTYHNRIQWAKFYLQKAKLIESTARGRFRITTKGLGVLNSGIGSISAKVLLRLDSNGMISIPPVVTGPQPPAKTPDEVLDDTYQDIHTKLAEELIEQVMQCSPAFFERLVVDLLVSMGYGGNAMDAGQAVGKTGDGGIDGIIKQDPLGLDNVYVQAKRWQGNVGSPDINGFVGSLVAHKASKGVFITSLRGQKLITFVQHVSFMFNRYAVTYP